MIHTYIFLSFVIIIVLHFKIITLEILLKQEYTVMRVIGILVLLQS